MLTMAPGSSSDKPCFVEIFDDRQGSLGEIPVDMIQIAGVDWTEGGAEIPSAGEWNFKKGYCYYWDEDGNKRIFTKGNDP